MRYTKTDYTGSSYNINLKDWSKRISNLKDFTNFESHLENLLLLCTNTKEKVVAILHNVHNFPGFHDTSAHLLLPVNDVDY